jgi:hypothetical protein
MDLGPIIEASSWHFLARFALAGLSALDIVR